MMQQSPPKLGIKIAAPKVNKPAIFPKHYKPPS